MPLGRARAAFIGGILACTCALGAAAAPEPEKSALDRADELFSEGKRLLDAGEVERACELLAESQRLDPGGGTLLALALCHEKQGRLALAWHEYAESIQLARDSGNTNREAVARARQAAIEPQLGRLTIQVAPKAAAIAGLEITISESRLSAEQFARPQRVDPGDHPIVARAPGKRTFSMVQPIAAGSDVTVVIPELGDALAPTTAPKRKKAQPRRLGAPPPAVAAEAQPQGAPLVTAGWISVGVGAAAFVAGTGFTLHAIDADGDADSRCDDGVACNDPEAVELSRSAKRSADVATVLFGVGAVAAIAGTVLILTGKPNASRSGPTFSIGRAGIRF